MRKLILGILLCTAVVVVPALRIIAIIGGMGEDTVTFEAPGEVELIVEEPDRYVVWNEYRALYEGRTYSRSKELPDGVQFSLADLERGRSLPLQSDGGMSISTDSSQKVSVGYFEIDEPGRYRLSIQGLPEPRVFSIGPSILGDFGAFFGRLFLVFATMAAGMVGGILLIVFGLIEIARKDQRQQPPGHRFGQS